MSDQAELKKLNDEKKALNEKQKALREKLNAGKSERAEVRKAQAVCRKDSITQKAAIRELSASIYNTLKSSDKVAINKLADDMMEAAAELSGTIRKFAETCEDEL